MQQGGLRLMRPQLLVLWRAVGLAVSQCMRLASLGWQVMVRLAECLGDHPREEDAVARSSDVDPCRLLG